MKREAFLARLRSRPAGTYLHPLQQELPPRPSAAADYAEAFSQAALATGSQVVRGDHVALLAALLDFGRGQPPLAQEAAELRELLGDFPVLTRGTDPFQATWGVSFAEAGLAHTGSACLRRTAGTSLLPSLVPPRAAIVVRVQSLFWELGDYLGQAPSSGTVHVVSGPSRSADIENDLSIGVHGPGEVLYLLWDQ
jgi:hypothetical protein